MAVSLLVSSCGPEIDSKKLGLSKADQQSYDSHLANANLGYTIGIVAVVLLPVVGGAGIWYEMRKKKAKARVK
jgi:hypothetical protein